MQLTPMNVIQMLGNAMNSAMGAPCDMQYERTVNQRFKIIFQGFPTYPSGTGVLVVQLPVSFIKINEHNDIICRELQPNEIYIHNGKTVTSTTALVHTNIFSDGHPCLGSGLSAVRIRDLYDFAAYIVASALRINMTGQSFLSPTTRKYGATPEQMQVFKTKVREMLRRHLGDSVLELDYSAIYDDIKESFNDQYRMYMR